MAFRLNRTLCSTHMLLAVGISSAKLVHVVLLLSTSSKVSSLHHRRPSALYAERYVRNLVLFLFNPRFMKFFFDNLCQHKQKKIAKERVKSA
jgi:hypothetical protein